VDRVTDVAVAALADAAGLLTQWEDAGGNAKRVSIENLRAILTGLGLSCGSKRQCAESLAHIRASAIDPCRVIDVGMSLTCLAGHGRLHFEDGSTRDVDLDTNPMLEVLGYHKLEHAGGTLPLIVCPPKCITPEPGVRGWGLAVQIYALRGQGPFGDFTTLADFASRSAGSGAHALMLSPVHSLFTTDPSRYSPYSPSSRDFLNPWYADPGMPLAVSDSVLIDWSAAVRDKLHAFGGVFDRARHDPAFLDYVRRAGPELRVHALFETLHAHFFALTKARGWQDWPAEYHDPNGHSVAAFANAHADEVDFHLFLQWRAETGLAQAAHAASAMRIGLVADIAVGLDAGGSHAWSRRKELMMGIGIGAPPDAFQSAGQDWGITTFSPIVLKDQAYAPFVRMLRSAMRHAGGIRIDHALGLRRLWVVPTGASPLDGAYLRQPEADLLRIIALESVRNHTMVIGEDLGVVPPGLREELTARGLLGMRVLPFEREKDGGFRDPGRWDEAAVAMTSTHDLPPVAGWWQGMDIEWRAKLGAGGDRAAERKDRAGYRDNLWAALERTGIAEEEPVPPAADPASAVDASISFVAKTAATLAIYPVEDLAGLDEAPNLPGTIDEHPNWRRRLPVSAEGLFACSAVASRIARIRTERPA
jgi:4-alpha-glucanotransferase